MKTDRHCGPVPDVLDEVVETLLAHIVVLMRQSLVPSVAPHRGVVELERRNWLDARSGETDLTEGFRGIAEGEHAQHSFLQVFGVELLQLLVYGLVARSESVLGRLAHHEDVVESGKTVDEGRDHVEDLPVLLVASGIS